MIRIMKKDDKEDEEERKTVDTFVRNEQLATVENAICGILNDELNSRMYYHVEWRRINLLL